MVAILCTVFYRFGFTLQSTMTNQERSQQEGGATKKSHMIAALGHRKSSEAFNVGFSLV
jgi:hypothetical protein